MKYYTKAIKYILNIDYTLVIGEKLYKEIVDFLVKNQDIRKILIVTDSVVEKLYLNTLIQFITNCVHINIYSHTVEAGENSKDKQNYHQISDILFKKTFTRNDIIISLGGGMVGDLTGFIASTYKRGINWINIPTTLLSMVDASIGGKTAINNKYGKNMVGTFYNPIAVFIDISYLKSLEKARIIDGLVELTKHFILKSNRYYNKTCQLISHIESLNDLIYHKDFFILLYKSILIKKTIIQKDPLEKGLRKVLNIGHTIGHAIEKIYPHMTHGEAVAKGIIAELTIGVELGITHKVALDRIKQLYHLLNIDITISSIAEMDQIINLSWNDKKRLNDTPNIPMVMIKYIGKVAKNKKHYTFNIPADIVKKVFYKKIRLL